MAARRQRRKTRKQNDLNWLRELSLVSQLGITMVMSIACFFVAGFFLDKWLNTKPIFSLIFILLGIASGGYLIYKQIMEILSKSQAQK